MTSHADALAITSAAAALFRAAATSATELDNGARLLCLAAFEHLDPPGPPASVPAESADAEALIRSALRLLATLPPAEFDKKAVLDAAAAGRRALLHLG
jgi:hypothetical protein